MNTYTHKELVELMRKQITTSPKKAIAALLRIYENQRVDEKSYRSVYYKKNFYIGLSFSEYNPKFAETEKACAFYYDTDHELEDRSIIYKDIGTYFTPEYNYLIKISSKEDIDNLTESDYNKIIMDFEHKIKSFKIKNRIDDISKDFE